MQSVTHVKLEQVGGQKHFAKPWVLEWFANRKKSGSVSCCTPSLWVRDRGAS